MCQAIGCVQDSAVKRNAASVLLSKPRENVQESGFSRAGLPNNNGDASRRQGKVDGIDAHSGGGVVVGHVADLHVHRLRGCSSGWGEIAGVGGVDKRSDVPEGAFHGAHGCGQERQGTGGFDDAQQHDDEGCGSGAGDVGIEVQHAGDQCECEKAEL